MKTRIKSLGLLALSLAVAFSFSFSTLALANEIDSPKVELKFIGKINDQPVFQLDIKNADLGDVTVTIKDDEGTVLYFNKLKGTDFSKKFQLNTEELGDANLRVEVKSRKSRKTDAFEINRYTRVIEETLVSKL